ncbi:MAG: ABC transporter permease subunit, partial [Snowella sp.]
MFTVKIKKVFQIIGLAILGFVLVISINYLAQATNSSNTLKVATDPTFPPFEMTSKDGNLTGFDIDLMQAIGGKLGSKINFIPLPFAGIIGALQANQVDGAISAMTITKEREQTINFTRPYFKSGLAIAVREDNQSIKDFANLKGKKIAVQIGTTGAEKAKSIPGAEITTFDDSSSALQELVNLKVDAVVNDYPATLYAIKTAGLNGIKIVGNLLTEEYYGIALPKNSPSLNRINVAIDQLIKEGSYKTIYQKWFGSNPPELPLVAPALNTQKQPEKSPAFDWINLIKTLIIKGLPSTFYLTIPSFIFGLSGGCLIAIVRLYGSQYISKIAELFVEFFRGTPLLVQLYIIYFGLPSLLQSLELNLSLDKYMAAVIALSINLAAYIAEIARGAIESIEKGQWEACHSLALNKKQTMWYVILPQAFRRMLPPLGNQFISLIKDSSLAAVIGLEELFRQGQLIVANTFRAFFVYTVVAIIYLLLSVLASLVFKWLENRL